MPITYDNRKGFTYFLNKGLTKTGKARYYFSREQKDEPVEALPAGYEIEESVNGIVSLVKSRPRVISLAEVATVQSALDDHPNARNYRLAVKRDHILIYEGIGGNLDALGSLLEEFGLSKNHARERLQAELERYTQFTPVMRFILDNQETRDFHAERWHYGGEDEGWIFAGYSGKIDHLAKKLILKLGTEAFFSLY